MNEAPHLLLIYHTNCNQLFSFLYFQINFISLEKMHIHYLFIIVFYLLLLLFLKSLIYFN